MSDSVRLLRVKYPIEGHLDGLLTRLGPEQAIVQLDLPSTMPALEASERLIIEWSHGTSPTRAVLDDLSVEQTQYTLNLSLAPLESDARHYPRLIGGIALSFMHSTQNQHEEDAWLNQVSMPNPYSFLEALDELMNFSVYGLAFESTKNMQVGARLLCEVGLSRSQERWRTRAEVVRAWQISEARFGLAIFFHSPPSELIDTLAAYTLELQKLST